MVGIIVSRAVGEPLADYLSRKIWAPYGMESDASWLTDGGTEIGGCCLNVTLRAYGRLGLFMMEGGSAGGAGVVPAGWTGGATTSKSASGETIGDAACRARGCPYVNISRGTVTI